MSTLRATLPGWNASHSGNRLSSLSSPYLSSVNRFLRVHGSKSPMALVPLVSDVRAGLRSSQVDIQPVSARIPLKLRWWLASCWRPRPFYERQRGLRRPTQRSSGHIPWWSSSSTTYIFAKGNAAFSCALTTSPSTTGISPSYSERLRDERLALSTNCPSYRFRRQPCLAWQPSHPNSCRAV